MFGEPKPQRQRDRDEAYAEFLTFIWNKVSEYAKSPLAAAVVACALMLSFPEKIVSAYVKLETIGLPTNWLDASIALILLIGVVAGAFSVWSKLNDTFSVLAQRRAAAGIAAVIFLLLAFVIGGVAYNIDLGHFNGWFVRSWIILTAGGLIMHGCLAPFLVFSWYALFGWKLHKVRDLPLFAWANNEDRRETDRDDVIDAFIKMRSDFFRWYRESLAYVREAPDRWIGISVNKGPSEI